MELQRGVFGVDFLKKITNITKKPETFLGTQENVAKELTSLLKLVYDYTKTAESSQSNNEALPELIIQDFDEEQIWQELELQNDFKVNSIISDAARLAVQQEKLALSLITDTDEEEEEENDESKNDEWDNDDSGNNDEVDGGGTDDNLSSDKDYSEKSVSKGNFQAKRRSKNTSVVDDAFFKLDELNAFLEQEDKKDAASRNNFGEGDDEVDSDNEDIDFFEDIEGDQEDRPKYSDFFSEPHSDEDSGKDNATNNFEFEYGGEEENDEEGNDDDGEEDSGSESEGFSNKKKKVRFDLSSDNGPEIQNKELPVPESNEEKSHYEICQDRLRNKISHLETAAMSEKAWQMKGEVSSKLRPENSLLEEVVDFQMATRPAPIFTEVTTISLEGIIKSRIINKDFNDVKRKVKTVFPTKEFRKSLVLNEEKSKQSLAEIYEQDYKSKISGKQNLTADDVENKEFTNIRKKMATLFTKLDALANYHFLPKPSLPELRVITNVPAVNMEEVAPIATTSANLLAPEEVKAKGKGDLMSKEERTSTDKKRERRHKKLMQHHISKGDRHRSILFKKNIPGFKPKTKTQKNQKLIKDVTKSKNVSEMKIAEGVKITTSSTSFFSSLQSNIQNVKTMTKAKGGKNKEGGVSTDKKKGNSKKRQKTV